MKRILFLLLAFLPFLVKAQRTFDTTFTAGGWTVNARVSIPTYFTGSPLATDSAMGFIGFVGKGEVAIYGGASLIRVNGMHNYMYNYKKWDGGILLGNGTHYPFIITVQQPTEYFQPFLLWPIIQAILNKYPIKRNSVVFTGLSAGGWAANEAVTYRSVSTDSSYGNKVRAVANVQGVVPSDSYDGMIAYPARFKSWAHQGGKELGFEQSQDNRDLPNLINNMNLGFSGSGFYQQTNYGTGGHGYFNMFYGDSLGQAPVAFVINGTLQTMYQWMARQCDTVSDLHGNSPPNVSAGSDQTIQLPTNSATATGIASGNNGATISIHTWSQLSGPSIATIGTPSSYTTTFTSLIQGDYVFKLTVTDNLSQTSSSNFTLHVLAAAVPYKHIGVIGSSTAKPYFGSPAIYPADSGWVWRVKNYFKSINAIDTIYDLAQTSTTVCVGAPKNFTSTYSGLGATYVPDTTLNIDAILKKNIDVILVHYPTNGYDVMDITTIMRAFREIKRVADSAGKPIFFVGTQPRGNFAPSEHQRIIDVNDSLRAQYGSNFIDYYDSVAVSPRSYTMNPIYWLYYPWGLQITNYAGTSYADSVHMNAGGQAIIARRVINKGIFGGGKPIAFAGNYQEVYLPTSAATFAGTATAQNGSITSITWSQVAGDPSTITTPSSLTSTVTGLTWGNKVYKLRVVQSDGQVDSQYLRINVIPACNTNTFTHYTLSTTATGEIYRATNADYLGAKGGDTIFIPAGNYTAGINLGHLTGDPCHPIYIKFAGPSTVSVLYLSDHTQYIDIDGSNSIVTGVQNTGIGCGLTNHILFHNFTIQHIPNGTGIIWKRLTDTTNPETLYPNYIIRNIKILNNTIDDIGGEGMYIGHTAPNGGDNQGSGYPIRMDSVEIAYNSVTNTDWDGIQLSNARGGCSIHDNYVHNYGRIYKGSQQAGIILGGNTTGSIFSNTIIGGSGNGVQIFGYGLIPVYSNSLDSCGRDTTANGILNGKLVGEQSIFSNDPPITVENNPSQQLNIYNNIIKHPWPAGAIVLYNDNYTVTAGSVANNNFCIPNATANWQTLYIITNPLASQSNNIIFNCVGSFFRKRPGAIWKLISH